MIVGQVAVGHLGELGRARDRGEAAVDVGAEMEDALGEQIGLLEVEVGLLLEVFVERHDTAGRSGPSAPPCTCCGAPAGPP